MTAAAMDLCLHLVDRAMAEWDAALKAQLAAAHPASPSGSEVGGPPPARAAAFPAKPMHAARVVVVTGSWAGAGLARAPRPPPDARRSARLGSLFDALGFKAAALDAQLDALVGDAGAPPLPLLLDAASLCGGLVLHQPGLAAPLAANLAALAGRRLGWDAFLDVRTPPGLKVAGLAGPLLAAGGSLPGSIAPIDPQPLPPLHVGDGGGGGGAPAAWQQPQQQLQAQRVSRTAVAATRLSPTAAAAPAIDRGRFYGAALEMTSDLAPGVAQEVQVLWEWTTADGRRVRQVRRSRAASAAARACARVLPSVSVPPACNPPWRGLG